MGVYDFKSDLMALHDYNVNMISREIYLHEYYVSGDESINPGIDYRMAISFIKNINFLNSLAKSDIVVHQYSTGGNFTDGMAIYDALKTSLSDTVIIAYSEVSSMSSITIQGATARLLMPNVEVLIHRGFFGTSGIPSQVYSGVEWSKRQDQKMFSIYSKRCVNSRFFKSKKMNEQDVTKYIEDKLDHCTDWFMDSQEAIDFGFADKIVGTKDCRTIYEINKKRKR